MYNQLCLEATTYALEGAATEDGYSVAMTGLKEAVDKVATAKRNSLGCAQWNKPYTAIGLGPSFSQMCRDDLHDSRSSGKPKHAVLAQEAVLLKQPVDILLAPSGFTGDPKNKHQSAGTPPITKQLENKVTVPHHGMLQLSGHSSLGRP